MGVKWRDDDAYERLARQDREDFGPIRGLMIGLLVSIPLWALLVWLFWF
jgi:hypothetical protein